MTAESAARSPKMLLFASATALVLAACGGGGAAAAGDSGAAVGQPQSSAQASSASATITGTISFQGSVPLMQAIDMQTEEVCNTANQDDPKRGESWVVGPANGVANVLVQIKGDHAGAGQPAPAEPLVFDQAGCQYAPHVFGIRAGQTLRILNPDGITHNISVQPKVNAAFNAGMPAFRTELEQVFDEPEDVPFAIRCGVHPWMSAWGIVLDHPFFAVTGADGRFSINNLPAGTYEVEIWHEAGGVQTQTITVGGGATVAADFVVSAS